jgi:hypothetical protein
MPKGAVELVIAGCGTSAQPQADELGVAAVLDDWAFHPIVASLDTTKEFHATGRVSGSLKFANGHGIGTSAIAAIDTDRRWIRTKNSLYRLGFAHADDALIVRAACEVRNTLAFRLLAVETGPHTLDGVMTEMMNDVAISVTTGPSEAVRDDAAVFADALLAVGRKEAARAWRLLAVDPADQTDCGEIKDALMSGHAFSGADQVGTMIEGWAQLAAGKNYGIGVGDPIWAAHHIGRISEEGDPDKGGEGLFINDAGIALADVYGKIEEPRDGVIVIPAIGGMKKTSGGQEIAYEFKNVVGKKLPLFRVPPLAVVRKNLLAEYPYAERVIDVLMSDLVGRDDLFFRPTLIIGNPGSGKSRLILRIGQELNAYVGRYDGAGSGDNAFGGTARRWYSGEPCWPINVIRAAGHANPIMQIDEIEKSAKSRRNGSLVHALLPMIERESGKFFPDPYLECDCDISHVSYLLTGNDDTGLPAPLRDRLRILRMPSMGPEHIKTVADSIVAAIAKERGLDCQWFSGLDADEAEIAQRLLGDGSIRRLQKIVEKLIAARDNRAVRH